MGKTEFENLPFGERPDLTPYLVHLTRNTKGKNDCSAFDNLVKILQSGKVKGSDRKGYVKGPNKAACFMDVPFMALKYVLKKSVTTALKPKYEPYGIFITKKYATEFGCRPVLYLSDEECDELCIKQRHRWRVVGFEPSASGWISWIHEREWRCKGDFKLSTNPGVLVRTANEVAKLLKLIDDDPKSFRSRPRTIIPLNIMCQGLAKF